jgi:hypothetical protein
VPHSAQSCLLPWLFQMGSRDQAHLTAQSAQRHRDSLVAVPGGVLVDERRPRAGVPEPGHQLLKTRASSGGKSASRVPEIVKMHAGHTGLRAGLDSYPAEIGPPQPHTFGPMKTRPHSPGSANRSRCQRISGTSSAGKAAVRRTARDFRRLGQQRARVQLRGCLHDPELAQLKVDVVAAQSDQLAPAQTRERGQQYQHAVTHR